MSEAYSAQWDKELKILLDKVAAHPSADLAAERERIVVLQKLIAAREHHAAG